MQENGRVQGRNEELRSNREIQGQLVNTDTLEGLLSVILRDPVRLEWAKRKLLSGIHPLQEIEGFDVRDEQAVMKKLLEVHLAGSLSRFAQEYPGLISQAVPQRVDTQRFRLTPRPVPHMSVRVQEKYFNSRTGNIVHVPRAEYAAALLLEDTPIIFTTAPIPHDTEVPDAITAPTINRLAEPILECSSTDRFGYVVLAVPQGQTISRTAIAEFRRQGGLFQTLRSSFSELRAAAADVRKEVHSRSQ